MRRRCFCAIVGISSLLAAAAPTTVSRAANQTGAAATADAWRYRWHDGRWWYYLPNSQWVYWDGTRWSDVVAARPRQATSQWYWNNGGYNFGRQDLDVYPNRD